MDFDTEQKISAMAGKKSHLYYGNITYGQSYNLTSTGGIETQLDCWAGLLVYKNSFVYKMWMK